MGNELTQGLFDDVAALDERGKRALAPKEMIATEMMTPQGGTTPTACPHCGGDHIARKGKDRK